MEHESEYEKVIVFSRDERKQEDMAAKFRGRMLASKLRFFVGDVRDYDRLSFACRDATHIIHAAALKIVPTLEYNPDEAIKTNVHGSQNLIKVAHKNFQIKKVLFVSTDKAVSPTNLYGATKLCMEKVAIAANDFNREYGAKFSVVRYGNVTGSRGSVVPLFKALRDQGKAITVTHKDCTRFWITLDEARDFVLQCLQRMHGAEIFLPDMPTYKVLDLARIFSDQCGAILYTGLRPGEKVHEELVSQHEIPYLHDHEGYYTIEKELNENTVKFLDTSGLERLAYTSKTNVISQDMLRQLLVREGWIE